MHTPKVNIHNCKPLTAPPGAIVIHGPQGCGKTIHGAALAKHFGKTRIVDDWHSGKHIPNDAIAFTREHVEGDIPFADAMHAMHIHNQPWIAPMSGPALDPTEPRANIQAQIVAAIAFAKNKTSAGSLDRATCFVAALSGRIKFDYPGLSNELFSLLDEEASHG